MSCIPRWFAARLFGSLAVTMTLSSTPVLAQSAGSDSKSDVWAQVPESLRDAVEDLSPGELLADLSFIADDLLAGRDTPSPGQEIAAHYIAAQFRGAGLEPVGDDGYFQTAAWQVRERGASEFSAMLTINDQTIALSYDQVSILSRDAMDAAGARLVRIASDQPDFVDSLDVDVLSGSVVLTDVANFRTAGRESRRDAFVAMQALLPRLEKAGVAGVIAIDRSSEVGTGFGSGELINPDSDRRGRGFQMNPPLVWSHSTQVAELFDSLPNGPVDGTVNLVLGALRDEPVSLRNVIGMLPGSDPLLRDEYILVTAHYDHLGTGAPIDGDGIFNGANDDGSGTVSVMALARTLGSLPEADRPARSILFMTVFGEERGLLGSRYYASHPIKPLKKTIANVNLEQIGRTDSNEGPQIRRASFTGFAFSTMTDPFVEAGQAIGVDVFDHAQNSEPFFARSDNIAFAAVGIPAHTLCVAFAYPDYHGRGDHWDKIDYENMARVDQMVALGLYLLADAPEAPQWDADHPRTGRYVEAWQRLHAQSQP